MSQSMRAYAIGPDGRRRLPFRLSAWLKSLPAGEASDSDLDCSEGYKGCEAFGQVLIVLGEAAVV